jgi:hypothetical protein
VPGVFARVGAAEKRKLSTGEEGAQILCIGGMPGRVYEPLPIVQLGEPRASDSDRRSGTAIPGRGAREHSQAPIWQPCRNRHWDACA